MVRQRGSKGRMLGYSLAVLALAFLGLHLFIANYAHRKPVTTAEQVAIDTALAINQALSYPFDGIKSLLDSYVELVGVKQENKQLKNRVAVLESKVNALIEVNLGYRRLLYLQEYAKKLPYNFVAAKVIGHSSTEDRAIYINKGMSNGIAVGMPAVTASGIIGRVTLVSNSSAKIMLITDPLSSVSGRIQRTRIETIVDGDASGDPTLRFVQTGDDVRRGDVVITSGLDGIFPEGLPIGHVVRVEKSTDSIFLEIGIVPYVDLKNIEELLVIKNDIQVMR